MLLYAIFSTLAAWFVGLVLDVNIGFEPTGFLCLRIVLPNDWPGIFSRYHNRQMVTPERHAFWAEFIVNHITESICERESLKSLCLQNGMTEDELDCIFAPWGGCIRALCERRAFHIKCRKKSVSARSPV